MEKKYIWLFFIVLGVVACTTSPKRESVASELPVLHVGGDETKQLIPFDTLFRRSNIVVLETADESLIREVSKIRIYKNSIYILDARNKRLLQFDEEGNFVRSIAHFGEGPGEYRSLVDFQIKDEKLYLLDKYGAQLLVYDLNDQLLSAEPIAKAEGFDIHSKGYALNLGLGTADGSDHEHYYSYSSYTQGAYVNHAAPYNRHALGLSFSLSEGANTFYHYYDSTYTFFPFNDTIYTVSADGRLNPYQVVSIGELKMGPDDAPDKIEQLRKEGISVSIFAYYKLGSYSLFSYYYGQQNRKYVLVDSAHNVVWNTGLRLDEDKFPIRMVSFDTDRKEEWILSLIYPFEVIGLAKKYPENEVLTQLAGRLTEESNPILIFYTFTPPKGE